MCQNVGSAEADSTKCMNVISTFPGEIVDPRNVLLSKVIWDELRSAHEYCGHIDGIKLTGLLLGLYICKSGG